MHDTQAVHIALQDVYRDTPGEKGLGEIAAEDSRTPNGSQLETEFLENASTAFWDPRKAKKEAKKKGRGRILSG